MEVDCTAGGEATCQKVGVRGYPTLKYWTATTKGGEYNGGRDATSMKQFINEKMQSCNVKTLKGCQPNQVDFIKKNKDLTADELGAMKKEKSDALKALKKERSEAQAKLREQEKGWSRTEKNINKALGLIKQLEKTAPKGEAKKEKAAKPEKDGGEL